MSKAPPARPTLFESTCADRRLTAYTTAVLMLVLMVTVGPVGCASSATQQAPPAAAEPPPEPSASAAETASDTDPPSSAPAEPENSGEMASGSPEGDIASDGTTIELPPAAATEDSQAAQVLLDEGRAIQRQRGEGGVEEAIGKYRAAIAKDGRCAACYWELGWSEQIRSDWQACLDHWDMVRRLDANFPEMETHYPVALMRRDQAKALADLPAASEMAIEEEPRAGPTLSIKAVGDVHMGRGWPDHRQRLPPNDAMDLFTHIKPALAGADLTFGNLETVLMDQGESSKCGPKSTKCFAFRVPTRYAKAVRDAGFDIMSIANNHTGDFGAEGRKTTMAALDAVGIAHSGPIGDLVSIERNGLRIGMVAFSTGGGVYRVQDVETAQRVVASLQQKHDLVIVSFHGGAEGTGATRVPKGPEIFYGESRGHLRKFTHAVIDAGADVVIGHGPHVFRGMELYKNRLIAYSLGNFSTWETFSLRGALGVTGVLSIELASNGVLLGASLAAAKISKPGRPRPDPSGRVIKAVRRLSKADFGSPFLDKDGHYRRPKRLANTALPLPLYTR